MSLLSRKRKRNPYLPTERTFFWTDLLIALAVAMVVLILIFCHGCSEDKPVTTVTTVTPVTIVEKTGWARSHTESCRSAWEDGVFWGFHAAASKGISGNDALVEAYRLKEHARNIVKIQEDKLKKYRQ